jgi:hypothetical protein
MSEKAFCRACLPVLAVKRDDRMARLETRRQHCRLLCQPPLSALCWLFRIMHWNLIGIAAGRLYRVEVWLVRRLFNRGHIGAGRLRLRRLTGA